jgi:hypothetical protein
MSERDIEKNPYSQDEARVAKFFFDLGVGGGDDPIGYIISSHRALAAERNVLLNPTEAMLGAMAKVLSEWLGRPPVHAMLE